MESTRRTDLIVARLVTLGNRLQLPLLITFSISFGVVFGILGALVAGEGWWWLTLIGLIVGILPGLFAAAFLVLVLEWMAQMLVLSQNQAAQTE